MYKMLGCLYMSRELVTTKNRL